LVSAALGHQAEVDFGASELKIHARVVTWPELALQFETTTMAVITRLVTE
jgi:hypothetical protein